MAFTSTDLAAIEAAMVAIASGERVVEVTIAGKIIKYQAADLNKLQQLRNLIQADVNNSADSSGFLQSVSFKEPT
jgi:hypothetical protein